MDGLKHPQKAVSRIGVFGGTFDPPHLGHLILAMEAFCQLGLNRLLWMVTPDPPHKQNQEITPVEIRLQMVQAAILDDPSFEISTLELNLPAPQYALNTVRALKNLYPGVEICYLIGEDSLQDLPAWHEPVVFVTELDILGVMRRPGGVTNLMSLQETVPGLQEKIRFIDAPLLEISSHQIRDRIRNHHPYKYYLPEKVDLLIRQHGLYLE